MSFAIFDSGIGGFSVLFEIIKNNLKNEIFYYADNKNMPFGNKNKTELIKICQDSLDFLNKKEFDFIIIACNTACTIKDELKSKIPLIFISDYTIKAIKKLNNSSLILCTQATLNSGLYQKACFDANINANIIAPVEFASLVEEANKQKAYELMPKYFVKKDYENILFACTHYPFLHKEFAKYFPQANLIDPAKLLVKDLKEKINSAKELKIDFLSSANSIKEQFLRMQNEHN
ncbi:glutamate racemase [Campylobacter canadensis]|uniref:Aspartate/glutamate racemase family protein n=1 Tax=Campylobacter canadensis TaxID=449520 RepID=A0ABS7WSR6_9BACT|nr:aspartate/glutamate racemase family protein [Campylobacter canadensis]MBZ7987411.1 aspartate/glutamate racemase family protein [Campylobacter canadensis]MBZ7995245.1 aspartate/glutamate racemase family protein [Campylobacter canadensis]MBZ7996791.1 aspartate/glutamate racemase family protein [Campylobacter canadensis]MBZ7998606.1 aspartate/glutamate racemase family protein [Campylobacter canadensis]MBZ8000629.1 aspartate/glutamate racemase family protein [Campylobacter canadensis]